MNFVENIGGFLCVLDPFNGITIDEKSLPSSKIGFENQLNVLLEDVKNSRNLIWIYIPRDKSSFIEITSKYGFIFHSCDEEYLLVVKRLFENAIIPTAANHTLGVGVVVINENNELLVIKEKINRGVGYKIPGGHIDNGELISTAAIREVYEETGIEIEFDGVISLGHFYPHQFRKTNLYVLCTAKPLTSKIDIKDSIEIEDAKWVDVDKYLCDENVLEYSKAIVSAAINLDNKLKRTNEEVLTHIKKDIELFF